MNEVSHIAQLVADFIISVIGYVWALWLLHFVYTVIEELKVKRPKRKMPLYKDVLRKMFFLLVLVSMFQSVDMIYMKHQPVKFISCLSIGLFYFWRMAKIIFAEMGMSRWEAFTTLLKKIAELFKEEMINKKTKIR